MFVQELMIYINTGSREVLNVASISMEATGRQVGNLVS